MLALDYTGEAKSPSASQVIADWRRQGAPDDFEVTYRHTYARFTLMNPHYGWGTTGNGCMGVPRQGVLKALNERMKGGLKHGKL
jgi:hypothetical protein